MGGLAPTRIITFLLVAAGIALGQQADTTHAITSLPDAPTVQNSRDAQTFRAFLDTGRPTWNTLLQASDSRVAMLSPFASDERLTPKESAEFFTPGPSQFKGSLGSDRANASLMSRAAYAASSIVVSRDDEGRKHLNTSYLLSVATIAAAHVAYRPYWRRSTSQPFADFGSTIGSEAGVNVLHEFEPGLLQLMKSHEPRFVSRFQPRPRPE